MKIKVLLFLGVSIIPIVFFGQKSVGILCIDFKINNEKRQEGIEYRRSLESVLSTLKYPPLIIDREKMQELLNKIEYERNLKTDLNIKDAGQLKNAQVDYLMFGNLSKSLSNVNWDLSLECTKIIGENTFSKVPFPIISFTEKDILNTEIFRSKLFEMLKEYAFTDEFGIIQNAQLNKIYKRLDEKDIQIKLLDSSFNEFKKDANDKSTTLKNLSSTISNMQIENAKKDQEIKGIKEYANVAEMDMYGRRGPIFDGSLFVLISKLKSLMENAIKDSANGIVFKITDSALKAMDLVIQRYSNFPFGYSVKAEILLRQNKDGWKEYAIKAKKILEVTTSIAGHNPIHDQILEQLNLYIGYSERHPGGRIIFKNLE